ncbi:hypothetical protein MMPV_003858 [Pyropia vietnamensis]
MARPTASSPSSAEPASPGGASPAAPLRLPPGISLPPTQTVVRLRRRPVGAIRLGRDLALDVSTPVPAPSPAAPLLVHVLYLSVDPAMRGWMSAARSYIPPVKLGAVMRAGGVAEVLAVHPTAAAGGTGSSRGSDSGGSSAVPAVGDLVTGTFGMCEFATAAVRDVEALSWLPRHVSPALALGTLGMTGLTAYFGLLRVGAPAGGRGETVLVSAAAGATGSVVCGIAKNVLGCRVVGVAGGAAKCAYVRDTLGVDAVVDYKAARGSVGALTKALARACPDGVDIYFDNVGGPLLDAALRVLSRRGRVVLCGAISQYNARERVAGGGPAEYVQLLVKSARMEGFIVLDYAAEYAAARAALVRWYAEGKVGGRLEVVRGGIRAAPQALAMLFRGDNTGKMVVEVGNRWLRSALPGGGGERRPNCNRVFR